MNRTMLTAAITIGLVGLTLALIGRSAPAPISYRGPVSREDMAGMIRITGGEFVMGREGSHADEAPAHEVAVDVFWLDAHEVTNREFAAFVAATGHITRAEREGRCWAYVAGATQFEALPGTDWRHPQGPDSSLDDRWDHPVVCVSWHDARAYAEWAGKRLPTEAEWEYAARAGSAAHAIARAAAATHADPGLDRMDANIWEGTWPENNLLDDGHYYTAPVASYSPNGWGLHDMIGNVWEWTGDWYAADYYADSPRHGPTGADGGDTRVARGGSWFCSANYCGAYSTHFRGASPPDRAFNNVGFRCARDG